MSLPDVCFGVNPSDNALILIKRGERGYYPCPGYVIGAAGPEGLANHLNERRGINRAQREAMEVGSMFGWDCPGADPNEYDPETGRIRRPMMDRVVSDADNLQIAGGR